MFFHAKSYDFNKPHCCPLAHSLPKDCEGATGERASVEPVPMCGKKIWGNEKKKAKKEN